ncbi:hypothetical protein [Brevundimonas balnearis]|uniref:Integral membrane protein n=1 Tax=Brevundimonas balnearis TaxID=1572858 RepID=A0ABV6R4E8_9CAUL
MTRMQDRFVHYRLGGPASGGGVLRPLMWVFGLIATGLAVTVGAVLAVLTAAAVAVLAVVASVMVFFTGMALRARRTVRAKASAEGVIEARKVDGTWVAYGWDRQGR